MVVKRSGVAARYAHALADLNRDGLAALLEELDGLLRLLAAEPALWAGLNDPVLIPETRVERIRERLPELSPGLLALLRLTIAHHQIELLPEIVNALHEQHLSSTGQAQLTVTSAIPLDDRQMADLQTALAKRLGRSVILRSVVDSSILGGLIVVGDAWELDLSLRARLAQLQRRLETGAGTGEPPAPRPSPLASEEPK